MFGGTVRAQQIHADDSLSYGAAAVDVSAFVSGKVASQLVYRRRSFEMLAPLMGLVPFSSVISTDNQERYVLWRELMPVFLQLLPQPESVSLAECLVVAASTLADFVGWAKNPAYLPIFHEHLYQFTHRIPGMVRCDPEFVGALCVPYPSV
jgi:hypothetical protein